MSTERRIGSIAKYYGGLSVYQEGDEYFWVIEPWLPLNDINNLTEMPMYLFDALSSKKEIPKYLFDALNRHQDEIDAEEEK